jgi:alkylation response protein AidB-like acyl-CoA dehydrogenase
MIDFTFTEEQEMFRKAAGEFSETQVAAKVSEMEETGKVSDDLVKAMGEAEMMALTIPEEYGGLDLGYTTRLIAIEEISKISVAAGMMFQVFALGIEPILKFGTEEQKKKYLPGLAKGERLATTAVTEATGGSDPTGIRSTYKKDGEDYIVNGRKCFITNSHVADTKIPKPFPHSSWKKEWKDSKPHMKRIK